MFMIFLAVLTIVVIVAALLGVNLLTSGLAVEVMALGMILMKLITHSPLFQILVIITAALLLVLLSILHRSSRSFRTRDVREKKA